MSPAGTDARRMGRAWALFAPYLVVPIPACSKMKGRPSLPELHGLGAPSCPHSVHSGGSAQNPMPMRLPPVDPVPPVKNSLPRRLVEILSRG